MDLGLAPGHVASFDEPGTGHVTELGQRVEVRPLLNAPGGMHGVGGGVSERGGEDDCLLSRRPVWGFDVE